MSERKNPTRRTALAAAAWTAPAIAISSAAPAYATSPAAGLYTLIVPRTTNQSAVISVIISDAALPVTPGSVSLKIVHESGAGHIESATSKVFWTHVSEDSQSFTFVATAQVPPRNDFFMQIDGASTWLVTLTTPAGVFSYPMEIVGAAAPSTRTPEAPDHPQVTISRP